MMHTMTYVLLLIASVCIVPLVAIEYIFTPLTRTQMNQVVHWGVSELFFRHSDVCWKDSYGNTAGIPMICAPGLSQEGALCYTKCKSGFYNTPAALFCYNRCPSGFRDDGLFCAKPGPYGRGVGRSCLHGWFQCSCNSNEDLNGLMCYPKCRAGFHSVGCCICSPNCPSGWNDIGVSCTKPSHGRSVHPLTSCPAGYQRSGLLCYPTCRPGYHMVGPVCWKTCPLDQKSDCGLLCSKDAGRCAIATVDMILAPITIVANVFTFGAASKVAAAKKVLTNTFRLSRESTTRLSTMMSRGLIQSQYGLLLDSEIQVIINALESGIEELYEPMKNIYGTINAVNGLREIAIAQAMIIVSTSLKEYGLTIASFIDPTGIMSVISAFAKPSCRDRQQPPHFSGITHAPPTATGGTIPPSTRPPPPPFPTTQTPTITTTPTTPTDIQTTTVTPTPTPTPSPCSDPCVSSSAVDECVPGTCIGFSNNATGNREMDGTCLSTYTCTIRDICGGRDMIPPPTCIYGTAIWSPVDCSYQCPTTCTDGTPFHDCTNITCTSSTCNNGYECHINPCGNTTCTTMCTFNPHIACTNHPCSNKQVETECEANTCVADYSFGCDYTCTPKNTTCFPSSSDELPICRVGVATWDIVTCSWLCPSLCPDSTPIRTCSSTTTCDCLPGYTCTIDYCSGQECNKTCVPPSISTSSSCTTNPCQTKQAIDGCIENTCTYNMTYGCDFTCEYRPTSVLSATFVVYLSFPSNTSFDVISITIQSQLRDIAIRANMIEYFIINQDHIIQLHNSTSTAYQITIGIRGNNIQENVQQQMLSQFLTTLDNAAALQVQDQDQQQVHTFAIDTTYVEIKSQMMYTQTCPDGTTIGIAASCIGNEAIVETVSSSISSSSSSSMKATTIISIVIPIVVVILVITVIAIIIVKRSRRHTTHVQKMGDQVELQSNPAAGLGSNTL